MYQSCPALAQLIELGFETANETAGDAVGGELNVLPAAKIELELGTGDGYKPRVLWLAQAAVSAACFVEVAEGLARPLCGHRVRRPRGGFC
jgi:hypothetical protein